MSDDSREAQTAATRLGAVVSFPTDTRILITREFVVPARSVYRAWTRPRLIERWWGGDRGEVVSVEVDLRVGGAWRYVMTGSGGLEAAFHGEYREIVPRRRLVHTAVFEAAPGHGALSTVTFTETDGRTAVAILTEHANKEDRDLHVGSGIEAGMREGLDKLERIALALG
jgi:uncharacterized protein YndB with AHSA1/START domain